MDSIVSRAQAEVTCQTCLIKTRHTPHRLVLEFDSEHDLYKYVRFVKHEAFFPYVADNQFEVIMDSNGDHVLR